jgi:hypothetical protein
MKLIATRWFLESQCRSVIHIVDGLSHCRFIGFLELCQHNDWHYIVTFKDGNLPTVWEEIRALGAIPPLCDAPSDGSRVTQKSLSN